MSLVLDSSMALSWYLPQQASPLSLVIYERVQRDGALVPFVWHLEMANILGLKLRSGNLTQNELSNCIALLKLLDIRTDETSRQSDFTDLLTLMTRVRLTAYDAN